MNSSLLIKKNDHNIKKAKKKADGVFLGTKPALEYGNIENSLQQQIRKELLLSKAQ